MLEPNGARVLSYLLFERAKAGKEPHRPSLCNSLPLASVGGALYGLDEPGAVNCVPKAWCAVGPRLQIADKMSVDLPHVNRRAHKPTRDRGLLGCDERDV